MVYGTLRLINFAHGDVYMVGAFAAYYLARALGIGTVTEASPLIAAVVLLGSMAICALLGVLIELFAYRPVRRSSRLTALITAIGVSLFLERTRTGKAMRAVAFHRDAASLMGIPVDRIITITFAIGSALAAAAGFLVGLTNPKIEPLMGIMPGIKAFVAAVLGGIGSVPGAMIGGLLMGISEYLVVGYISSTYRDAIAFVILIAVLLIRPAGLLGKNVAEKV